MFQYPLKFSFSAITVSPKIEVKDAGGKVLFTASKKLLSSKDEIEATSGGNSLFKILSQENRITDIPSNWDVFDKSGKTVGVVDDDFVTALDGMKFADNSALNDFISMQTHRALHLRSMKMYWLKDTSGKQVGFIAPEQKSMMIEQLPLYQVVRKLPFAFRFITPSYVIQMGGKIVMTLKKERTLLFDSYTLESGGGFSDIEENFLISSIILTIVYERQRLKDLYQ